MGGEAPAGLLALAPATTGQGRRDMKDAIAMLATLAAVLAGCSSAEPPAADGKLAARVNGAAISLSGGKPSREKLERVIDRELLVQKAIAAGLDRDPQVAAQVEEARREVLAQAYVDRAAARSGGTPAAEVARFYEENPALFAQRRVYRY